MVLAAPAQFQAVPDKRNSGNLHQCNSSPIYQQKSDFKALSKNCALVPESRCWIPDSSLAYTCTCMYAAVYLVHMGTYKQQGNVKNATLSLRRMESHT